MTKSLVDKQRRERLSPARLAVLLVSLCGVLCVPLAAQDDAINVPLTDATVGTSPFEVHGSALIHEVVLGNQLEWSWGENVVVKNVSDKPVLLLMATLAEAGRHPARERHAALGDGPRYTLTQDRFFSDSAIQPAESVVLRDMKPGTPARDCCVNPMDETREPRAEFKILFVQFTDGSVFGDPAAAAQVLGTHKMILEALRQLGQSQPEGGEESFAAKLEEKCISLGSSVCSRISAALEGGGTLAALAEARRSLAVAEEHEAAIRKKTIN